MRILAVDTALGACSAAVVSGAETLAHRFVPMQRGHAEALAPMVADAMRDAKLGFAQLDRLAVTTGPGTFTGQRVGLAFMRALRVALQRPLVGVTSLAAIARQAMEETKLNVAAAIHDARRDEVYFELLQDGVSRGVPRVLRFEDAAVEIAQAARAATLAVAGTAAAQARDWCSAHGVAVTLSSVVAPDALWVARLGASMTPSDEPPKPLYLREPDAKLPGAAQ